MKKGRLRILLTVVLVMALWMTGCQKGYEGPGDNGDGTYTGIEALETRSYDLTGFSVLNLHNDFDTTVTQGDKFQVAVTTNADVFDKLHLEVVGQTLKAGNKEEVALRDTSVKMTITMPKLQAVTGRNDVQVKLVGAFSVEDKIIAEVFNDASVTGQISGDALTAKVQNDGLLTLSGQVGQITANGENDGTMDLSGLLGLEARVSLQNDARCAVNVSGSVTLNASNSPTLIVHDGSVVQEDVTEDTVILFP